MAQPSHKKAQNGDDNDDGHDNDDENDVDY